jgi:hypothetical protein
MGFLNALMEWWNGIPAPTPIEAPREAPSALPEPVLSLPHVEPPPIRCEVTRVGYRDGRVVEFHACKGETPPKPTASMRVIKRTSHLVERA